MTAPLNNHTIPESAKILRTSAANVYRLIKIGELVAVQFGSRYIVTDEDLRTFIFKHRTAAAR